MHLSRKCWIHKKMQLSQRTPHNHIRRHAHIHTHAHVHIRTHLHLYRMLPFTSMAPPHWHPRTHKQTRTHKYQQGLSSEMTPRSFLWGVAGERNGSVAPVEITPGHKRLHEWLSESFRSVLGDHHVALDLRGLHARTPICNIFKSGCAKILGERERRARRNRSGLQLDARGMGRIVWVRLSLTGCEMMDHATETFFLLYS